MAFVRVRELLTHEELTAYFLAVWEEVVAPVCGGFNEHVLEDFVASHTEKDFPATEWRFQGKLGFGGKLYTGSDMVCRVGCYLEDDTEETNEIILKANGMLEKIYERFFLEKIKALADEK